MVLCLATMNVMCSFQIQTLIDLTGHGSIQVFFHVPVSHGRAISQPGCNLGRPDDALAPLFIGLTVTLVISVIAPLTQAGINPARDLGPRLFAALAGWGAAAFPEPWYSSFTVYIVGPCLGGLLAAVVFTKILQPLMERKRGNDDCGCR